MVSIADKLAKRLPERLTFLATEKDAKVLHEALRYAVIGALLSDSYTPRRDENEKEAADSHIILQNWTSCIFSKNDFDFANIPAASVSAIRSGHWDLSDLTFFTDVFGFDVVDDDGFSLLHIAIVSGKADIALELLKYTAFVDYGRRLAGYPILHWAAASGNTTLYKVLHDRRDEVLHLNDEPRELNGELPLSVAIRNGHADMVKTILSTHSHESEYVNTVNVKDVEDVDDVDDVDDDPMTPLGLAVKEGKLDIAQILIEHPNINYMVHPSKNHNVLHHTADYDEFHDLFRELLTKVPENMINMQNDEERTPLHYLVRKADRETMDAILRVPSVKTDLSDKDGTTPILAAVQYMNLEAFKALALRRDVDVAILWRSNLSIHHDCSALKYMVHTPQYENQKSRGNLKEILSWLIQNCSEAADKVASLTAEEVSERDVEAFDSPALSP
ncbi:ankyrin repeat protein [Colletotrichum musicola]|uniref:Ankyrin repeat protein n=1 Tax=Colletotrichum musicola TaxID=2175873 RepID=A0A8H6KWT2_9PEZI|nr:ankyrin repeat protein [Colletotrichum musicola]